MTRFANLVLVIALVVAADPRTDTAQGSSPSRRMSFHNRLLLNRAAVSRLKSVEMLVLCAGSRGLQASAAEIARLTDRLGGRVLRTEGDLGYLRVDVPTDRVLELVASPVVAAYQLASLSRASWYRDGPPLMNAEMFRGFEVTPIVPAEPSTRYADLPPLSIEASRAAGYTADDDVGLDEWMAAHPTFDGRGVTIAIVEGAQPPFADPTLRAAKTLDGRDVPKVAGILNTIDSAHADSTRLALDQEVRSETTWARIGRRTYILPLPGEYRFGMLVLPAGANLVQQFGVLEREETREVWVDTNGDASFQDESPVPDVNDRFEPRFLKLKHPRAVDVSFVVARASKPGIVHIYLGRASHEVMTLSTAVGGRSDESLAYGVAPNARVLLVRNSTTEYLLGDVLEGFITAAQRPDVDVVSSSGGITLVPDTAADFGGLLFERLVSVYGKPIVNGALNNHLQLGTTLSLGSVLSVGGAIGPKTYAALHGGRPLRQLIVHPTSSAGPSLDGDIKPDFIAPVERIAADLPWNSGIEAVPWNAPSWRLPPGYQVSCCTSASGPYAAGVVALLISGAKQTAVPYSADSLARAMKASARFVPGFGSHEQGNGVLDIKAAWRELTKHEDAPRIVASADIVHPLAQYAARGRAGKGILEFDGWTAGMVGRREIRLRRESGPERPLAYRLAWTGNDGTFSAPASVTLPLGSAVSVPITIAPRTAGAHGALLNLQTGASEGLVFRTQAMIVAAEPLDRSSGSVRITGRLDLMRTAAHYIQVPPGIGAISFELEVLRGVLRPTILPAHGLFPGYYLHVHPRNVRFVEPGKHTVVLPNPEPGTWTIDLANTSMWFRFADPLTPADDGDAEYAITVRAFAASIQAAAASRHSTAVEVVNPGAMIREPVLTVTPGILKDHRASFRSDGLPDLIDISVPEGAVMLSLQLRSARPGTEGVEMYLYDCTSGECFSYDIRFPSGPEHTIVVRHPKAGRWVAAINAAPFPTARGGFVLEEVITTGRSQQRRSTRPILHGQRWMDTVHTGVMPPSTTDHGQPVLFVELLDAAIDRDEATYPWDPSTNAVRLRDRPVALGTAIVRR